MHSSVKTFAAFLVFVIACPSLADVIVEYDRPTPTFGRPVAQTLRQHGDRTRIDSRFVDGRTGAVLDHQEFTRPGQAVRFGLSRFQNGDFAALSLMDDPGRSPVSMKLRSFTGGTEIILGEHCKVWKAITPVNSRDHVLRSGCITKDGIELWTAAHGNDRLIARKINRQRVSAADVRIPLEALDLSNWTGLAATGDHSKDYEIELEAHDGLVRRQTERRSGPWISVTEVAWNGARTSVLSNNSEGIELRYLRDPDGKRQLSINKLPLNMLTSSMTDRIRLTSKPDEHIFGEVCHWWDMWPNTHDATRLDCITADGVVMASLRTAVTTVSFLTAVRFNRGAQPVDVVIPNAEVLSPSAWGF
jgi:hypothetical protein